MPSDSEEMCWRIGLFDGLKRPGLEEGVLAAVFDAIAVSIVEVQRGESRHGWRGEELLSRSSRGQQAADMAAVRDNVPIVR